MRFVFVYTDANIPSVSAGTITKIEYSVVNNKKTWTITLSDNTTRTYNEDQGRPAILWD